MIRLNEALRSERADEGFSLVEVIVSMLILALVSTGIIASTQTVVRMTADNRSRQVAANLAEQQLDADRGILDPFNIHPFGGTAADPAKTYPISNRTYTVTQTTSLISVDGAQISCGSGKAIYYRQITVQVDWTGRLPTTSKVQSDTVMSPNGRINDSSTGSIAILVTGAAGTGESGVTVTITPVSGTAMALQSQPTATDVEGCSYALGVNPGTYKVAVSRSGFVDTTQVGAPYNGTVVVAAGVTTAVTFSYDQANTYNLTYPVPAASLPTNMAVTFLSAGAPYVTSDSSPAETSVSLYPYPAGYSVIAGEEATANGNTLCAAEDPAAWTPSSIVRSGVRGAAPGLSPGGTSSVAVPMGTFTVSATAALYLKAVGQSSTLVGQPGCSTVETFTFTQVARSSTVTLALPYGTYKLYWGLTPALSGLTTAVGSSLVSSGVTTLGPTIAVANNTLTNGPLSTYSNLGGLVLDPRSAA